MTNILKFRTKKVKLRDWSHNQTICKLGCCRLEDGSYWYRIGTLNYKTQEYEWDEWRKIDE